MQSSEQKLSSSKKYVPLNQERQTNMTETSTVTPERSHAAELQLLQQKVKIERDAVDTELARLRKQISDQEDKIAELNRNFAALNSACKSTEAASQTETIHDEITKTTCETQSQTDPCDAATVTKEDAVHDTESPIPVRVDDQPTELPYVELKKKRKLRKNRSRGARRRAKAAASARARAEVVSLAEPVDSSLVPANETSPVAVIEDRRYFLIPERGQVPDHSEVPTRVAMKGLFQRLIDPRRLSHWFQASKPNQPLQSI
jgi:hypothetical protein